MKDIRSMVARGSGGGVLRFLLQVPPTIYWVLETHTKVAFTAVCSDVARTQ